MSPPSRTAAPPRRLHVVLVAACVLLAGACAGTAGRAGPASTPAAPAAVAPSLPSDTITEPMEIRSYNGVLDVTLAAVFQPLSVPNMGTKTLRTYQVMQVVNGTDTIDYADSAKYGFPGPTLRVFPGDSVHIVLLNQMWDTTTAASNPQSDTSNIQCASYPASVGPDTIDHFEDCFHGNNWTNIHYHGMHVTPDSNGDDVLLLIPPGATYEYGFRIPHNQSAGTHWYHPHKHGSVAIQVINGMSGALIVDGGPLDTVADAHGIRERVIALQQIDTFPNLFTPSTFGHQFLVNGQLAPVIVMAPGEVQRWRIVNENVTKTASFALTIADSSGNEPQLYEVARDGVAFANANYAPLGSPEPDDTVLTAPGNRIDLFVQAPLNGGIYSVDTRFIAHSVPQDRTRKRQIQAQRAALAAADTFTPIVPGQSSAFFVMVDTTLPRSRSTLPARLPALPSFLANLPGSMDSAQILADTAHLAVVVFADSGFSDRSQQQPTAFFLGTAQNPRMDFNSSATYVPQSQAGTSLPMVLDSVQTWKVMNISQATNHPFHIHINPFQVIDAFYPNAADPNAALYAQLDSAAQRNAPIWLDVVPLPLPAIDTLKADTSGSTITLISADTTPGYVLIRQEYQPFLDANGTPCTNCGDPTGWFVMHCHILGHEERGMMQVLEIVNTGQQPSPPPPPANGGVAGHAHPVPAVGTGQGGGRGGGDGHHRH